MKGRTQRASGGGVEEGDAPSTGSKKLNSYTNEPNKVIESAEAASKPFKKGGKVSAFIKGKMSEGAEEAAEKKRLKKKDGGCAEGGAAHHRADRAPRKGRASGGPLSTAANTSDRPGGKVTNVG